MCYITLVKPAMDCLWLGQIGGGTSGTTGRHGEPGGYAKIYAYPKFTSFSTTVSSKLTYRLRLVKLSHF